MEQRSGPVFQQRFVQASQVDFKVAECETHSQLMEMLGTDDGVEVTLRSLAAWIHHRRTGDSEAFNFMLAVRGPGSGADIAPNCWFQNPVSKASWSSKGWNGEKLQREEEKASQEKTRQEKRRQGVGQRRKPRQRKKIEARCLLEDRNSPLVALSGPRLLLYHNRIVAILRLRTSLCLLFCSSGRKDMVTFAGSPHSLSFTSRSTVSTTVLLGVFRRKRLLQWWRVARSMISLVNGLDTGNTYSCLTVGDCFDSLPEIRDAQRLAGQEIWFNASVFARARRDLGLTGDHAGRPGQQTFAAILTKEGVGADGYARVSKSTPMVPLLASLLDEPLDESCVDMLLALPPDEAWYYTKEEHLLELSCKSRVIMQEIESHYGFAGGSHLALST